MFQLETFGKRSFPLIKIHPFLQQIKLETRLSFRVTCSSLYCYESTLICVCFLYPQKYFRGHPQRTSAPNWDFLTPFLPLSKLWRHCYYISVFTLSALGWPPLPTQLRTSFMDAPLGIFDMTLVSHHLRKVNQSKLDKGCQNIIEIGYFSSKRQQVDMFWALLRAIQYIAEILICCRFHI